VTVENSDSSKPTTPPPEDQLPPNTDSNAEGQALDHGAEEELPEYEELTPEYLEDECIRGDIMLRWATILLGVLGGWLLITETPVLVSVRTGEYLLSHGILPPRADVFSATAEGRPWVNLHWLTDLVLAGMHSILGMAGLTILSAFTVGATMWTLSKITLPQVTTWWGSVCSVIALIAFFPVIQPGVPTITLLGLALLGALLFRFQTAPSSGKPWLLILLMVVWTNLDPHCWIGLLALLLFLIGELLAKSFRTPEGKQRLLMQGGALLGGILISPWPLQPALQLRTVLLESQETQAYQSFRDFFPLLDFNLSQPEFWRALDIFATIALALAGLALITLLLNWKRLHPGWALIWLGTNALGFFWGESIYYVVILNAVIAAVNGQDWCRHQFKMDYAVTNLNVLWSRLGRAGTVLGIFVMAYLMINGALMGAQGRRIGTGLDPRWKVRIESLETQVLSAASSDRIYPTTPSQGDLLIWAGKKPFVDSRLALYKNGDENLLELHREIRSELFSASDEAKETPVWKEAFERFKVNDVFVRLWGPRPPYVQFFRIDSLPSWQLTGLGSAGAILTRADLNSPELKAHLEKFNLSDFAALAFRPAVKPTPDTLEAVWPFPVSRYDSWLVQRLEVPSPESELAFHYLALLTDSGRRLTPEQAAGLAVLSIRHARQGLLENPNHPLPYRVIGKASSVLQRIENQMAGINSPPGAVDFYDTQILASAFSAAVASQENPGDLLELFQLLLGRRSLDVAFNVLNRYRREMSRRPSVAIAPEMQAELNRLYEQLQKTLDEVGAQVMAAKEESESLIEVAAMAAANGCPMLALGILEQDLTKLTADPDLQLFYTTLLLQCGRLENAFEQIEGLGMRLNSAPEGTIPPLLKSQWRTIARSVHLSVNNLNEYIKLSTEGEEDYWKSSLKPLIQMPFASTQLPLQMELWPAYMVAMTAESAIELPERWASLQFSIARAELLRGDLDAAQERFQRLLKLNPRFSMAPVAISYLRELTGTEQPVDFQESSVPEWIEKFETLSVPR